MVQALTERPPFVQFETRSIEDRDATIKAGMYIGNDVDYAIITPAGSKDRIERIVSDWFKKLHEDVQAQRVPDTWLRHFEATYDAWKKGQAAPVTGYPIKDWPGLSPSQVKSLQSLHLLAVEDVAAANEETLGRIGMGSRALKQRAIDFLAAANDFGKVAEKASALTVENIQMKSDMQAMAETMASMQAQLAALQGSNSTVNQQALAQSDSISAADLFDSGTRL